MALKLGQDIRSYHPKSAFEKLFLSFDMCKNTAKQYWGEREQVTKIKFHNMSTLILSESFTTIGSKK